MSEQFRSKLYPDCRYADSGRPVVVRNASLAWPAMSQLTYSWLKEEYTREPDTLDRDEEDCWFNR